VAFPSVCAAILVYHNTLAAYAVLIKNVSFIIVISIYITFCQQRDSISSDSTCTGSVVRHFRVHWVHQRTYYTNIAAFFRFHL